MWDTPHSIVLMSLVMELGFRAKAWKVCVLPLHWVEVGEGRRHTADICVVAVDQPLKEALKMPPLLCIEIISPEDKAAEMDEKVQDYLNAGVKAVWQIFPGHKKAYEIINGTDLVVHSQLSVPGTDIVVFSNTIFAGLQELEAECTPNDLLPQQHFHTVNTTKHTN